MRFWLKIAGFTAACMLAAVVLALFLLVQLLHAPPSHTIEALQYLVASSVVALAGGILCLCLLSRYLPNLATKIAIASTMGSISAILVIVYTPWMMFASRSDLYILLITLIYFVTISVALAYIIAVTTTRRLQDLHRGASAIAAGRLDTRVKEEGVDEIADLARAFNRMSTELAAQFERERRLEHARRDLIAAVSHDLRTPLASIQAMVEAINDGVAGDEETRQRYLHLIQQESRNLAELIDDLFELSRIESGTLDLHLASVPLPELVNETVEGMRIQAKRRGVNLQARCRSDVPDLALDAGRMQRVLINLIQNAVRHTPAGGEVTVEVAAQNGHVEVAVTDTGEGVPVEDRDRVFEQFFRGEKSRSRDSGGAGLGLAIAKGIVEAHHGSIKVEDNGHPGARFVVSLRTA